MAKTEAKTDIVAEMVASTEVKAQGKDETAQDFLTRLHKAVDKLHDEDWKLLSDPAQKWFNDSSTEMDAKKPPLVPDGVVDGAASDTEEAEEETVTKKVKGKKVKAAVEPAPTEKKAKGKKAKGDKKEKGTRGRPRVDDDAVLVRKVKTLPEGNRNDHWDKIPAGTKFGKIRKNKTHLRVTRYWRRKGFVELRAA